MLISSSKTLDATLEKFNTDMKNTILQHFDSYVKYAPMSQNMDVTVINLARVIHRHLLRQQRILL